MSNTAINPTVGRVVWFYLAAKTPTPSDFVHPSPDQPLAATIAAVHSERIINLSVSDHVGRVYPFTAVQLLQEGDDPVDDCYATWMPYQVGQAKKHADEPKALASTCVGQVISGGSGLYGNLRYQALEMALRTPGLAGHEDVLQAAAGYQAHIEGEMTLPAPHQLVTGCASAAHQVNTSTDNSDAAIEQEIVAKGKTAPRVTPADIEANIASEHYFTAAQGATNRDAVNSEGWQCAVPKHLELLTFCVLVLQNGFTVTGESACASPENFDAEIGRKVARQNAVQKIWPLMGYALKEQLCRQKGWACPDCCQGFAEMPTTCPNNAPGCNELLAKGK